MVEGETLYHSRFRVRWTHGGPLLGGPGRLLHRCNTCYIDSLLANDIADIAASAVHALS